MNLIFKAMIHQLKSEDESRIISGIQEAVDLGDYSTTPYLIDLLEKTSNHTIRDQIALALRDIGDERAVKAIANLLTDVKTLHHRGTLIYALSAFDCTEILPLLVELVISGGFEVSREAFLIVENIEGEIEPNVWNECQHKVKVAIEQASEDKVELLKEL
ncbi:HEAT repeat domain-containing protein [Limnofasciculus baicalensis]|uniref:HEAT repeat domain-containing protein n=1 Tax=Limnofasciculus baicalensis BBK-W-15 TaxID=2699891 RepID=A0AAE3GQD2_9CYAN|nr:HEAT repeat domain-containing protein [Limnofasciculus baicalensis]MCP2728229.1 HEAT repeat domain-containing protein [Limnofasciculus baicalensis BBK-W-15]